MPSFVNNLKPLIISVLSDETVSVFLFGPCPMQHPV